MSIIRKMTILVLLGVMICLIAIPTLADSFSLDIPVASLESVDDISSTASITLSEELSQQSQEQSANTEANHPYKQISGKVQAGRGQGYSFSVMYSDEMLLGSAIGKNPEVAKFASVLASAAYDHDNAKLDAYLGEEGAGFTKVKQFFYGGQAPIYDCHHVAFSIWTKKIDDYLVYCVPVRGTTANGEWYSNFIMKDPYGSMDFEGKHYGFHVAARDITKRLEAQFDKDGMDGKRILLITGHSRGAAIANIVAGQLTNNGISADHLFGYTFACPAVAKVVSNHGNIFNFNSKGDPVPLVPMSDWGYQRNGEDITEDPSKFESFSKLFSDTEGHSYIASGASAPYAAILQTLLPVEGAYDIALPTLMFLANYLGGGNDSSLEEVYQYLIDQKIVTDVNSGSTDLFFDVLARMGLNTLNTLGCNLDESMTSFVDRLSSVRTGFTRYSTLLNEFLTLFDDSLPESEAEEKQKKFKKDHASELANASSELGIALDDPDGINAGLSLIQGATPMIESAIETGQKLLKYVEDLFQDGHDPFTYVAWISCKYNGYRGRIAAKGDITVNTPTVGPSCFENTQELTHIRFSDTLKAIGANSFAQCTSLKNLVIPNSVTYVGEGAFSGCTGLQEVTMPVELDMFNRFKNCANVQSIHYTVGSDGVMLDRSGIGGDRAERNTLEYCSRNSLNTVIFDEGTTHIADYAFYENDNIENVTLPETVESIGEEAFYCVKATFSGPANGLPSALKELGASCFSHSGLGEVTIPAGVTVIPACCFSGCQSLKTNLPEAVVSLNWYCFADCPSLEKLEIPVTVTHMESGVFYNCTGLREITLPVELPTKTRFDGCCNVESIRYTASGDGVMPARTMSDFWDSLEYMNRNSLTSVVFDSGVTHVDAYVLYQYSSDYFANLTSVTLADTIQSIGAHAFHFQDPFSAVFNGLPESLTTVGSYAFYNCIGLTADYLPESLTKVGESAFYNCIGLTANNLPDGLVTVGESCFRRTGLGEVTIPAGITEIPDYCFAGCDSLKTELPETVVSLGEYCFADCTSLERLEIRDTVTHVGICAFSGCTGLREVTMPVEFAPFSRFYGCTGVQSIHYTVAGDGVMPDRSYYDNDKGNCYSLTLEGQSQALKRIIFDEGTTHIADYAFYFESGLESITLPETVESIGDHAFDGVNATFSGLANGLPGSLKELGEGCFNGTTLGEITIPAGVTVIPDSCFCACEISKITFDGDAPRIVDNAFFNVQAIAIYHGDHNGWTEDVLNNYGGELTWLDAGSIHDDGWLEPTYEWAKDNTSVTARRVNLYMAGTEETETATVVLSVAESPTENEPGATTFTATFTNPAFTVQTRTEWDIPALSDMYLLRLPTGLQSIMDEAFENIDCQGVIVPDGVTTIGSRAFANCTGLFYVRLPSNSIDIAADAFEGCLEVRLDFGD